MSQQLNIVYLLLSHLNRHLWMEIPGIGVFTANKSATYIDHMEKKIFPSRLIIEFVKEPASRSEAMIKNMFSETGYELEVLEEHLAALCQTIQKSLKQNNQFEFKPFGFLKYEKDNLIFMPSDYNIHQDFYKMIPLDIEPAKIPIVKNELKPIPVPFTKTKSKKEFKVLLIALGLLWVIFLSLLFCPPAKKSSTEDQIKPLGEPITTEDQSEKTEDLLPIHSYTDSTEGQKPDSSHPFEEEVVIDTNNVRELNEKIKYKPCVIIVGSFLKISNADRLSIKVTKAGYQLFREEFGKYNRVGIQFNCFELDLEQMIGELKQKFHPEAWVLKF